jgi:heavy metal efflux system protein
MNRVLGFALRQRLLIVAIFFAVLVAGGFAFAALNIEAYPDPVPPLVEVVTQTQGLSAEEMERNVTVPLEVAMAGIPHLTTVRGSRCSAFPT